MKQKNIRIIVVGICISFVAVIFFNLWNTDLYKKDVTKNIKSQIKEISTLSMIYETEIGSGEYELSNATTWPKSGYSYNEHLSKCENGSIMEYDVATKTITVKANVSDKCYVYFDKKGLDTIPDVCNTGDNLANCIKQLENNSTYEYSRILHHNASLENGANDDSYRYSGGNYKVNENYIEKYAPLNKNMIQLFCYDDDYEEILNGDADPVAYYCENYYYYLKYEATPRPQYSTYQEALSKAMSDGAIIKNNPVNNYVCFGSDDVECPEDNLYQIIGVFGNQVKLVKSTPASIALLGKTDTYYADNQFLWNPNVYETVDNTWADAPLNKENLSVNYLNNIGTNWSEKISIHNWNVGGIPSPYTNGSNAQAIYDYEFGNCETCPGAKVIVNQKIGLMYASDYVYAVDSTYWNSSYSTGIYERFIDSNWLYYNNASDYTISIANGANQASSWVINKGNLTTKIVYGAGAAYVRPTFYLNQNIKYNSGIGSKNNPYRISI